MLHGFQGKQEFVSILLPLQNLSGGLGYQIVAGATQVHCMLQSLQVLDALWAPAKGFVMSALWLGMNLRNSDYVLTVKCW